MCFMDLSQKLFGQTESDESSILWVCYSSYRHIVGAHKCLSNEGVKDSSVRAWVVLETWALFIRNQELASSLRLGKAQTLGHYHCSIACPGRGEHLPTLPRSPTPFNSPEEKTPKLFSPCQNYSLGLRASEIICRESFFPPRIKFLNFNRFSKLFITLQKGKSHCSKPFLEMRSGDLFWYCHQVKSTEYATIGVFSFSSRIVAGRETPSGA